MDAEEMMAMMEGMDMEMMMEEKKSGDGEGKTDEGDSSYCCALWIFLGVLIGLAVLAIIVLFVLAK